MNRFKCISSGLFVVVTLLSLSAVATAQRLTRVSVDSTGTEADGDSDRAAISSDGRHVAFSSTATNLVTGDSNGFRDVFVHDRLKKATVRVSIASTGVEGNGDSTAPSLSADGRWVAFTSTADFVLGPSHLRISRKDVFVHDRDPDGNGIFDEGNGVTRRASVDSNGGAGNGKSISGTEAISDDGRLVVFRSFADNLVAGDGNGDSDIFIHELATGVTTRVSVDSAGVEANFGSRAAVISADGAIVAYESAATNLVPADTNAVSDVFVCVLATGEVTRVSVDSSGQEGNDSSLGPPSLSADGGIVAFTSYADNLGLSDLGVSSVFVHDRASGATEQVSVDCGRSCSDYYAKSAFHSLSADGRSVVYGQLWRWMDFIGGEDLVHFDRPTQARTSWIRGARHDWDLYLYPALAADGKQVAFASSDPHVLGDTNWVSDVFVYDRGASWANYGAGVPGTTGVPDLFASADPVLGSSITLELSNSLGFSTPGLLLFGGYPVEIPLWNGEGTLLVSPSLILLLSVPSSGLSIPFDIPDDPALLGSSIFLQVIELDPGAGHQLSLTPGLELAFGH